jgi:hypothetical protein
VLKEFHADQRAVASTYATSSGPYGLGGSDLTHLFRFNSKKNKPRRPAEKSGSASGFLIFGVSSLTEAPISAKINPSRPGLTEREF